MSDQKAPEAPFMADADPAFAVMRDDLRVELRTSETTFRAILREELLDKFAPEVAAHLGPIDLTLSASFIKGLEPFFVALNEMLNAAEALNEAMRQQNQTIN
jgi:hypothetical protein